MGKIKNTVGKFDEFKRKEKFVKDNSIHYPGIADPSLKAIMTEKINQAADDFQSVALQEKSTDKDYQGKIEIGLQRFNDVYMNLSAEDKERVCHYFEELMDMVGLDSSAGLLNKFRNNQGPE